MILVVGGSPEDGRWLEDALRPSGLAVTRPVAGGCARRSRVRAPPAAGRRRPSRAAAAGGSAGIPRPRARGSRAGRLAAGRGGPRARHRALHRGGGRGAAACVCPPLDPAYLRATVTRLARWRDGKGSGDRRRRRRRPLLLRVDVHLPDARVLVGLLRDVSGTGCRIESPERVAPGHRGFDHALRIRRVPGVPHRLRGAPPPGAVAGSARPRLPVHGYRRGDGAAAVCGAAPAAATA